MANPKQQPGVVSPRPHPCLVRQQSFWIKNNNNDKPKPNDKRDDDIAPFMVDEPVGQELSRFEKQLLAKMASAMENTNDTPQVSPKRDPNTATPKRREKKQISACPSSPMPKSIRKRRQQQQQQNCGYRYDNDDDCSTFHDRAKGNNTKSHHNQPASLINSSRPVGLVRSHNGNVSANTCANITTTTICTTGGKITPPSSPRPRRRKATTSTGTKKLASPKSPRSPRRRVSGSSTTTTTTSSSSSATTPVKGILKTTKASSPRHQQRRNSLQEQQNFTATLQRAEYWKGQHLAASLRVARLQEQKEQLEKRLQHWESAVMDRLVHIVGTTTTTSSSSSPTTTTIKTAPYSADTGGEPRKGSEYYFM